MHSFDKLVTHCAEFSLKALREAEERLVEALQTSGATSLVVGAQVMQLQRAISAVGMFAMFDAMLQDALNCADGSRTATEILEKEGELALKERFRDWQNAINVLKHGRGRSYDALLKRASTLPFRVRKPDENSFAEGDVSEVSTLILVDDAFVRGCAEVIQDVTCAIRRARSDFIG